MFGRQAVAFSWGFSSLLLFFFFCWIIGWYRIATLAIKKKAPALLNLHAAVQGWSQNLQIHQVVQIVFYSVIMLIILIDKHFIFCANDDWAAEANHQTDSPVSSSSHDLQAWGSSSDRPPERLLSVTWAGRPFCLLSHTLRVWLLTSLVTLLSLSLTQSSSYSLDVTRVWCQNINSSLLFVDGWPHFRQ